jgi:hypothetical protein
MKKTKRILFAATPAQIKKLKKLAKQLEMTMSEVLRKMIDGQD